MTCELTVIVDGAGQAVSRRILAGGATRITEVGDDVGLEYTPRLICYKGVKLIIYFFGYNLKLLLLHLKAHNVEFLYIPK